MSSRESAQALAERDPTVLAHRNTVDVHAWQGPPGIGREYFRLHKQDFKDTREYAEPSARFALSWGDLGRTAPDSSPALYRSAPYPRQTGCCRRRRSTRRSARHRDLQADSPDRK